MNTVIDRPMQVARRVLQQVGIVDPGQHTILTENVASLLTQMKPDFVDTLPQQLTDRGIEALNGSYAASSRVDFGLKLSRDVRQRPYTDAAVFARIDRLEGEMSATVARIVEGSAGYPCKFYVAGSLVRGRFGAESDIDLLVEASAEWMKAHRFDRDSDVSVQYIDCAAKDRADLIEAFAPALPTTAEALMRPGTLHGMYRDSVERKGYAIEDGHLIAHAPQILREVEVAPAAAGRIMWSLPMV